MTNAVGITSAMEVTNGRVTLHSHCPWYAAVRQQHKYAAILTWLAVEPHSE